MISLIIAKIGSERSSQLTKLIYTSDNEKRTIKYEEDIYQLGNEIRFAMNNYNPLGLEKSFIACRNIIEGLHSYTVFQIKVGMFSGVNKGSVRRLLHSIIYTTNIIRTALLQPQFDNDIILKGEALLNSIKRYAGIISELYGDKKSEKIVVGLVGIIDGYTRIKIKSSNNKNILNGYRKAEIGFEFEQKVLSMLPPRPWQKGLHKKLAEELNVSNNLITKTITKLIDDKKIV